MWKIWFRWNAAVYKSRCPYLSSSVRPSVTLSLFWQPDDEGGFWFDSFFDGFNEGCCDFSLWFRRYTHKMQMRIIKERGTKTPSKMITVDSFSLETLVGWMEALSVVIAVFIRLLMITFIIWLCLNFRYVWVFVRHFSFALSGMNEYVIWKRMNHKHISRWWIYNKLFLMNEIWSEDNFVIS